MKTPSSLQKFLVKSLPAIKDSPIAVFCNQSAYDFSTGKYLIEILEESSNLKRVFVPEHGFFSEFQDQQKKDILSEYEAIFPKTKFVSLYGSSAESLIPKVEQLQDIEILIIDIQDVSCRYFTYVSSIYYLFQAITEMQLSCKVFVIDKVNPGGRKVEGTILGEKYASFLGVAGLPHRYGLSIGELCHFFHRNLKSRFTLEIIPLDATELTADFQIQASPNFPSSSTSKLYSGTCLIEGTILSEGRGTTKPFELIGAPFLDWEMINNCIRDMDNLLPSQKGKYHLRRCRFIPQFHKFAGEICNGFQIHTSSEKLHALSLGIAMIHCIQKNSKIDIIRKGSYEYGSDKTALEILIGDDYLLEAINNGFKQDALFDYLKTAEESWIKQTKEDVLYTKEAYSCLS